MSKPRVHYNQGKRCQGTMDVKVNTVAQSLAVLALLCAFILHTSATNEDMFELTEEEQFRFVQEQPNNLENSYQSKQIQQQQQQQQLQQKQQQHLQQKQQQQQQQEEREPNSDPNRGVTVLAVPSRTSNLTTKSSISRHSDTDGEISALPSARSTPSLTAQQWEVFGDDGRKNENVDGIPHTTRVNSADDVVQMRQKPVQMGIPEAAAAVSSAWEVGARTQYQYQNSLDSLVYTNTDWHQPLRKDVENTGVMEELFVPDEIFPEEDQETGGGPILSRRRREVFSSSDFVNFQMNLLGSLSEDQRTTGTQANTDLRQAIESALKAYLDTALPGYDFSITVSDTNDIGTGITVTGEATFSEEDASLTHTQIAQRLLELSWSSGLVVFPGQANTATLNVQFPELGYQSRPLQAVVCYLCQSYETCEQMANQTWFCGFQDSRFYAFGDEQGDSTFDKSADQTLAQFNIQSGFPLGAQLFSDVWISLFGTINLGSQGFDSFHVQDLPVAGFDVLAVYWSHWIQSDLGEVRYQLYTKTSSNTAEELAVFQRANSDVAEYEFTTFDATSVLVVTWERVLNLYGRADNQRGSFQAAIITNGTETYLTYIYGQGALQIRPVEGNLISVGWGDGPSSVLDTLSNYFHFDTIPGNTGKLGQWFWKIGAGANPAAECINWYNTNVEFIDLILSRDGKLCPCTLTALRQNPNWVKVEGELDCYDVIPDAGTTWGRRCCYANNILDTTIPTAGSYQNFSPFAGDIQRHLREDIVPKQWCCEDSENCNLYYAVRPSFGCTAGDVTRGINWGDPHMVTLDGKRLTFNNLGEFSILNVKGTTPDNLNLDVKMQARTCRATTENGNLTDATVFCALVMRMTNNNAIQISSQKSVLSSEPDYMVIFVNGREYTHTFRDDPNFEDRNGNFFMSRQGNSLKVGTPEGVGFIIELQIFEVLEFTVALNPNLATMPRGLMGNFNGDSNDDCSFPNGNVLSGTLSDREIFDYVKTWAITQDESAFTYPDGQTTANFSDPNFVPIFLDEVDQSLVSAARNECDNDDACVYDLIATQNRALAKRTSQAIQTFDSDTSEIQNAAPVLSGPVSVDVTIGQNTVVSYEATDADNHAVTISLLDEDPQVYTIVQTQSGSVELSYTPQTTVSLLKSPTIVARDQENVASSTSIAIVQCSGCNDHGRCDFSNPRQVLSPYISIATCVCELPWTGEDCESDRNGCLGLPCPLLTTCTDEPAANEEQTGVAYTCSDCPDGYTMLQDKCDDVNECNDTSACPANSECFNNVGSFTCTCVEGYRKDSSGNCTDVNECEEIRYDCQQICVNTVGSYSCACEPGFTLDTMMGFQCDRNVVDPCDGINHNCSYGCRNANGMAECFCAQGYQLASDGVMCEDENECDQTTLCAQTCTNTVGSYTCGCYAGFTLAEDRQNCEVCAENKYGLNCASQCECRGRDVRCDNVKGCICHPEWTGQHCEEDVNECETQPNICPSEQMCVNTNGSYLCECPIGFQDTYNNGSCYDVDECADQLISMCPQECTNSPGSFFCYCQAGYVHNTTTNTCDDIDECEALLAGCDQVCINVVGSYNCQCYPGFIINDDRKTCRPGDVDPCENSPLMCTHLCTEENGIPTCFCERGYMLDGDGQTCIDIDECTTSMPCTDGCQNNPGGFSCSCPDGKKLANDQKTCEVCDDYHWGPECANQCDCNPLGTTTCDPVAGCVCKTGSWEGTNCQDDINECTADPCSTGAICTNTAGSFICACETGFSLDASNACVDVNECTLANPCDQNCTNTEGSFICSCERGFNLNGTKCIDIDECESPDLNNCEQECRNLAGGFQCSCREGYRLNLEDRRTCIEITECDASNNCSQLCRKIDLQDTCLCRTGFSLDPADNTTCNDIDECARTIDHICTNYEFCNNTIGSHTCYCKPGYVLSGDACIEDLADPTTVVNLSVRLDIPDASDAILDNTTQEFRRMEVIVSRTLLQQGMDVIGNRLLSVAVTQFTQGSFIADTLMAIVGAPGSEELAAQTSVLAAGLRTANVTSIAPGATVIEVIAGQFGLNSTTQVCEVFDRRFNCSDDFECRETNGVPGCREISDGVDRDLIIGLAVGIPLFLLLALAIAICVCLYTRRSKRRRREDSSQHSGIARSFESGIAPKWTASRNLPYGPVSYHSSESGSTFGRGRRVPVPLPVTRPGFSGQKPADETFEAPWTTKGAGVLSMESPRDEVGDRRETPRGAGVSNSNFSWEYMFRLLEPHVPFEIQRPQFNPQDGADESGNFSRFSGASGGEA